MPLAGGTDCEETMADSEGLKVLEFLGSEVDDVTGAGGQGYSEVFCGA
jgi:hypothetical protein